MSKSLDQISPFSARDRGISLSALNSMLAFNRALFNNLTVAAPLEIRHGANGVQISVNTKYLVPPGEEGDILYHDGTAWVTLAAPAADSVLYFDTAAGIPSWLATTDACPTTTTTTAAPTTTTA